MKKSKNKQSLRLKYENSEIAKAGISFSSFKEIERKIDFINSGGKLSFLTLDDFYKQLIPDIEMRKRVLKR